MRDISLTITRMYCARSGMLLDDAEQLLDGHRVADVVDHRRDVVEAVGVREHLRVGRVLRFLLEAAVQVAELHVAVLTVSPSTVRTMRTVPCIAGCDGPMLSVIGSVGSSCSFVGEILDVLDAEDHLLALQPWRSLTPRRDRTAHERLALLFGVVLAQRMADELLVHEDAAQIGMAART